MTPEKIGQQIEILAGKISPHSNQALINHLASSTVQEALYLAPQGSEELVIQKATERLLKNLPREEKYLSELGKAGG